jgi:hypothetical protein
VIGRAIASVLHPNHLGSYAAMRFGFGLDFAL